MLITQTISRGDTSNYESAHNQNSCENNILYIIVSEMWIHQGQQLKTDQGNVIQIWRYTATL